ncbi:MAG: hypothetical protein LBD35_01795 [Prevotellaceae bacterium]|nr:hypothetical protein [Prevotellaceae bacterium]
MKTNKVFRRFEDDSRKGEQAKGKFPAREKKSRRSIYDEIEEEEDLMDCKFLEKDSIEDYFYDDDDDDD